MENLGKQKERRLKLYKRGEWNIERVSKFPEDKALPVWHALMTPPGREIDAAIMLDKLGVTVFAPTLKAAKRAGKNGGLRIRVVHTWTAILTRYIFIGASPDDDWRMALFRTNFVRGILAVDCRPWPIDAATVKGVGTGKPGPSSYRPMENKPLTRKPLKLDLSKPVRVDKGELRGGYYMAEELPDRQLEVAYSMFGRQHFHVLRVDHVSQPA